jgi:hypothetical protein
MTVRGAATLLIGILAIDALVYAGIVGFGAPFIGIFLSVLSVGMAAFLVTTVFSVFRGAPFVPTDRRNVARMIEAARVAPGMHVVDLGSGDGRILIHAAKVGATSEGWEVNPWLWALSKWNARRAGVGDRVTVHLGSYWMDDVGHADAVFLFLIDTWMRKMAGKLGSELRPGTRVISYAFRFPDWEREPESANGVHVYMIPPK